MAKRRALGKGLNELLSGSVREKSNVKQIKAPKSKRATAKEVVEVVEELEEVVEKDLELKTGERLSTLNLDQLEAGPFQPREIMKVDALEQLAESIKSEGVIQPIVVRQKTRDSYEIIAGERRFRASKLAGMKTIPAIVKNISDESALTVALIENIQRENLNPVEESRALRRLSEELNLTHLELAERVGKSRTSVTNMLRLLTLNDDVQEMLEQGSIEVGHAKALLAVKGAKQTKLALLVAEKGLSVREVENLVAGKESKTNSKSKSAEVDPNIQKLEQDLSDTLCARVNIKHQSNGKGTMHITYSSLDELEGILEHITA